MMKLNKLKALMKPLAGTPLHPQWLANGGQSGLQDYLQNIGENKLVLDIGCFNQWPEKWIPSSCRYWGLDYFETSTYWYQSTPDIYGDASCLPIADHSIDIVLLLDVLEHVADTEKVLKEIRRILKSNGKLLMKVPFLYPLHDEPRDFMRLTRHGFENLAQKYQYAIEECQALGHPVETAALLSNIAITKTALKWLTNKNPALVLMIFLPIFIVCNNLLARFISFISASDDFMPYSYRVVFIKT